MKHSEKTKRQISEKMKGRRPGGFNVRKNCPHCDEDFALPNLKRHMKACKTVQECKHVFPNDISVSQIKSFKRCLMQYGLTIDDYLNMYELQKGKCKICLESQDNKRLFVDHCHKTNEVRGLLCYKCNTLIGMCDDNIKILKRAIEYLR